MLSSLFSGLQQGLSRAVDDRLTAQTAALDQRQRLLNTAQSDRTRRRLATRAARLRRRQREQADHLTVQRSKAKAAGSGLHLAASSKTSALLGQTATQATATAQATSVLGEALQDRLSRAALARQRARF